MTYIIFSGQELQEAKTIGRAGAFVDRSGFFIGYLWLRGRHRTDQLLQRKSGDKRLMQDNSVVLQAYGQSASKETENTTVKA